MRITFDGYVPDGPGAHGLVDVVVGREEIAVSVRGNPTTTNFKLPVTLPAVTAARPMEEADRDWVWSTLSDDDRDYLQDAGSIILSRAAVLTDESGQFGYILLMGEPHMLTIFLGGYSLYCNGDGNCVTLNEAVG